MPDSSSGSRKYGPHGALRRSLDPGFEFTAGDTFDMVGVVEVPSDDPEYMGTDEMDFSGWDIEAKVTLLGAVGFGVPRVFPIQAEWLPEVLNGVRFRAADTRLWSPGRAIFSTTLIGLGGSKLSAEEQEFLVRTSKR